MNTQPTTLSDLITVADSYRQVIWQRQSAGLIASSIDRLAVAVGEIEPSEQNEESTSLGYAGLFGIMVAMDLARDYRNGRRYARVAMKNPRTRVAALGVVKQLLYAMLDDTAGIGVIIRSRRTGFMGTPDAEDIKQVECVRSWVQCSIRFLDDSIESAWSDGAMNRELLTREKTTIPTPAGRIEDYE